MKTEKATLSNSEKIELVSNLGTMFSAGIPILETVESLLEDAKGGSKKILETMRADLTQGQHVSYTFAKFPNVFNKVTVNIIKASEEAGTLDVILIDLKENIKKDIEFSDKVKGAFIYPLFIMAVFALVLLVILLFVVPRISQVFSRLKVELPLPTKILIFLSDSLIHYTIPVVASVILTSLGIFFLYKTRRRMFINILFSLPLISGLARSIDLTRFSRSLFLLLNSGIPITSALELCEDVVMKKDVGRAITHAKETVLSGKRLSEGFKDVKKVIPSIVIKITEAGERSGSLDKSMQDISEYLDYQVSKALRTITTLMEPLLLVFVGLLVGGMMLAIIAPIYGLIGQVGGR